MRKRKELHRFWCKNGYPLYTTLYKKDTNRMLAVLKDSSNLATVKRVSLILILLFGLIFTSFAQIKTPGFSDDAAKYLKFYPNPASSSIAFEFLSADFDKGSSIEIYNFMGKKVYEIKAASQVVTLQLDDFYRGMYIYQLRDGNGVIVESGKFQVVK